MEEETAAVVDKIEVFIAKLDHQRMLLCPSHQSFKKITSNKKDVYLRQIAEDLGGDSPLL